jgi:DnaJ-class molecular chaperone
MVHCGLLEIHFFFGRSTMSMTCFSDVRTPSLRGSTDKWHLQGLNFEKLQLEVLLTPEQAYRGGQVQLAVPVQVQCPHCKGLGDRGFFPCWHCHGTGTVAGKRLIVVSHQPDTQDNSWVRLSLADTPAGALLLRVNFRISQN